MAGLHAEVLPPLTFWMGINIIRRRLAFGGDMANKFIRQFIVPQFWKKFCIMIGGIFFMGFFLSFLIEIKWGTDPYTFQNTIISGRIGWQFGTWQLVLNLAMLVVMVIINWRLIGLGTIANMVLIGYISDFFRWVWAKTFPAFTTICSAPEMLWAKILMFTAAILLFVISAAFYINAEMGLSPYDGIATIIGEKLKKIPKAVSRMCYDLFVIVVGLLSSIGSGIDIATSLVGSIVMALTLGPAIQLVGRFVRKRILKIEEKK